MSFILFFFNLDVSEETYFSSFWCTIFLMLHFTGLSKNRTILAKDYNSTTLPKNYQREIAVLCYKLINSGEQLTTFKLDKIIFTVSMKYKVKLSPPNVTEKERTEKVLKMNVNDAPFTSSFTEYIAKNKNNKTFWATDRWKSRFCKTYNLKYKKTYKTFYSKEELYCQVVPNLEMTFALRELSDIEGGKGLILNLGESMTYKIEKNSKTWSY